MKNEGGLMGTLRLAFSCNLLYLVNYTSFKDLRYWDGLPKRLCDLLQRWFWRVKKYFHVFLKLFCIQFLQKTKWSWKSKAVNNQDRECGKFCALSAKFHSLLVPGHMRSLHFCAFLAIRCGHVTGCEQKYRMLLWALFHNSSCMLVAVLFLLPAGWWRCWGMKDGGNVRLRKSWSLSETKEGICLPLQNTTLENYSMKNEPIFKSFNFEVYLLAQSHSMNSITTN